MAVLKGFQSSFKAGEESGLAKGLDALLVPGVPTKNKTVTKAATRSVKSHSSTTTVRTVQKLTHKVSRHIYSPTPDHALTRTNR